MKSILIAKTFGIGNAVMAVPMIKAIRQANPDARVDILVGSSPDDVGALDVLRGPLVLGDQGKVYVDVAREIEYDVAVLSIPFDGRWKNGIHFVASEVLDGRTRPDPSTTGLVSWKHHEVLYQMENAERLGWSPGPLTFSCAFDDFNGNPFFGGFPEKVYLGVGYKKDAAGFWKTKHWGNENYATLINLMLRSDSNLQIISSGDSADIHRSLWPISKRVDYDLRSRFIITSNADLTRCFRLVGECGTYVGNDTGMMHVAASYNRKVFGLFFLENSIVKSGPWCKDKRTLDGTKDRAAITPQLVFKNFKELHR